MRYQSSLLMLLAALLLSACGLQLSVPVTTGQEVTATPPPSETPAVTETPTMPSTCAYAWTDRLLPEVSAEVNRAFTDSGLEGVDVEASAFGENCIDPVTNQVAGFTAMQTDFRISVAIDETDDTAVMGQWIETTLQVLRPYEPGVVPGPKLGYVGMTFGIGDDKVSLWFSRQEAMDLVAQGRRGSRLFEELRQP